jgi:uncharacterized membrane protein (DUF2068 family)
MALQEDVGVWTGLSWHRWWALVIAVINLRVPSNEGNFLTGGKLISFSIWNVLHGVSK